MSEGRELGEVALFTGRWVLVGVLDIYVLVLVGGGRVGCESCGWLVGMMVLQG
jgi:hypothetical protein